MRVLWVSMNASLYDQALNRDLYGGGGWILSLQELLYKHPQNIQLGVTFLYPNEGKEIEIDGVFYYPIKDQEPKGIHKLFYYWGGYKKQNILSYLPSLENVVNKFKPDVIHLWGVENMLGCASLIKDIPVVAHLQGFLSTYSYSYYPPGMNDYSFRILRFSLKEWVINNGVILGNHVMHHRAHYERMFLQKLKYVMGRTKWDKDIALYNNPYVKYYHINEVLRSAFYDAPKWNKKREHKIIIFSTISQTIYKGFDTILKTAAIIKEYNNLEFEWHIAGVYKESEFTKYFEKHCKIQSKDVDVKLLGTLKPKDIIKECLNCDLYIHPSYIDNSPNSLCEAQYLGVPIIATRVGGIDSLIKDGKTGQLVPANAPFDLAFAIQDFYKNEAKWKIYANEGMKDAINRHDRLKIVSDLISAYQDILK